MHKKKVLVHGTPDSLQKFFTDAVSRDFEVVAILSDESEKISVKHKNQLLDVLKPQALTKCICNLVDGVIITDVVVDKSSVKIFLKQGLEPRKIILWDEQEGWGNLNLPDKNGTPVIYFRGLEFHLRDENAVKFFYNIHGYFYCQRQIKNLEPTLYPAVLAQNFLQRTGKTLDLNNMQTFTEKMQ